MLETHFPRITLSRAGPFKSVISGFHCILERRVLSMETGYLAKSFERVLPQNEAFAEMGNWIF